MFTTYEAELTDEEGDASGVQGGAELGNALPLDIVPALTVAVGRRPYIDEVK